MDMEKLEARIKELETQVKNLQKLQDIEEIKKLQKAYGYYLINWMHEELIDCFADSPDTTLEWPQGIFKGKAGVRRFFGNINKKEDPEFMHQMMQLSGIVNMEPDGRMAKGRWWGFGAMAIPDGAMDIPVDDGVIQSLACGIYEMEYIREGDAWKILKMKWVPVYTGSPGEGWVKAERCSKLKVVIDPSDRFPEAWKPDGPPAGIDYSYPSGYILPFHYNHPVTGKETSEKRRNKSA